MTKNPTKQVASVDKMKSENKNLVSSFEKLGLSEEVMEAVKEMGIEVPTEIQCIGIPAVLEEKSVVLGSHTGSGKTLAYMLPLVQVFAFLFYIFQYVNTTGSLIVLLLIGVLCISVIGLLLPFLMLESYGFKQLTIV